MTAPGRLAAALVVVAVSVALPFARHPAAGDQPSAATTSFSATGLSFRYPATWHSLTGSGEVSSFSALIVYLSSAPLPDPCPAVYCAFPRAGLPPGGVLVRWDADGFPGFHPPKPNITVGGLPADETRTSNDGWCQSLGGTQTITVMIPRPVPGNWYGMEACLRPPDLPYQEAQISAMLSSVSLAQGD
jgi:hypothetical protein